MKFEITCIKDANELYLPQALTEVGEKLRDEQGISDAHNYVSISVDYDKSGERWFCTIKDGWAGKKPVTEETLKQALLEHAGLKPVFTSNRKGDNLIMHQLRLGSLRKANSFIKKHKF